MQYVAGVVNKMSFLVIPFSTPSHTKAWGFAVDAARRLLLPSPMPAAPSFSLLIDDCQCKQVGVDRWTTDCVENTTHQKERPSWHRKRMQRIVATLYQCTHCRTNDTIALCRPISNRHTVTSSRQTDCCLQPASHVINKGNSKQRLRCVQLIILYTIK